MPMIDPEKLLSYAIPQGRQVLAPRDAALYALSIGMGRDPLDQAELDFIDVNRALRVVPSMAFVLAHPGFWFADPATSIDASGILHADQSLELLKPLSASGVVTSKTEISELIDKGPGKAALMRTKTRLLDESGEAVALLQRTVFLRGGGGFGGRNAPNAPVAVAPDEPPAYAVTLATRAEQALLYRLNGDLNPLHADPDVARQAGFERPILHGLCTAGIICHAILRSALGYDERRLRRLHMRFAGIVLPGETIIVEIWSNGYFRARAAERDGLVIDNGHYQAQEQHA
jgi:acyl dehydratase